ncbi:DUF2971 domain-containing protein [Pseudoalteromonas marina]|uniref:DUF2971 domain-containing protein n=1 Tax=Pseudoalteromonas marina TaxID=267375 RepID=UPI0023EF9EBB|nr:DUF2971 domain-containing protein [Pseudoalteromonas marina]
MILYKYVSFKTAVSIVKNSTIGFSCLEDLNDPFEGTSAHFEDNGEVPASTVANAVRNRMSRGFGVLSLTRTPLNPTMWSHYGDDHRGVVIGIDVDSANLNSSETNLVPAKYGDVIYSSTVPKKQLPQLSTERLMAVGSEIEAFEEQDYELFKRTFLYKALPWNYEEEVRVVKNINSNSSSRYSESSFENKSGEWNTIQFQGRPIYCLSIPMESVKEIYLGCSTYKNISRLGFPEQEYSEIKKEWRAKGISVFNVRQIKNNWQLESYVHNGS